MTQRDEHEPDDLAAEFGVLATLEVPRDLDPNEIAAGGRRRIRRRRWMTSGAAAGGVALATATVAIVVTGTGVTGTQPGVAGGPAADPGPGSMAEPLASTQAPKSGTPSNQPMNSPQPGGGNDPMQRWARDWQRALVALKVPINTSHGSMVDGSSVQSQTSVVQGNKAGYVAMSGSVDPQQVAAARQHGGCPVKLYPAEGTGLQCRTLTDGGVIYTVKTYTNSYQGRTRIVQAVGAEAVLVLSQSQGYPSHPVVWNESTKNLLPWDGRDPISENGPFRKHPSLTAMPLTDSEQLQLSRTLLDGR